MLKKIVAFFAALSVVAAFAAVDVNKASEAELDSVKGIGPVTSKLIITERKKGEFKDWNDFISRVKGVGEKTAAKFSSDGLTVRGASFAGAPAADTKVAAKAEAKSQVPDSKTVTEKAKDAAVVTKNAAVAAAGTVKETAKDAKAAVVAKTEKVEAKADAKAEAKTDAKAGAKVETKADTKADTKAETKADAKAVVKAEAAKPAAGTAKK